MMYRVYNVDTRDDSLWRGEPEPLDQAVAAMVTIHRHYPHRRAWVEPVEPAATWGPPPRGFDGAEREMRRNSAASARTRWTAWAARISCEQGP